MKWLIPIMVLFAGVCVFASGMLYGVITVGVPAPDATPTFAAQERLDSDLAAIAMLAGLGISTIGGAGLAVLVVMRLTGKRVD